MLDTIFGLPVHPLIVHATVVVVPTAAVVVLLAGLWPRFRSWAGWLPLGLALVALVLTPLSTSSGESLEHRIGHSAAVEKHSQLADGLLPWVIGLAVAAALISFLARRTAGEGRRSSAPTWLPVAAAVLAVLAAVGTAQQVVRIGHSGAEASWSKVGAQPAPQGGGESDG